MEIHTALLSGDPQNQLVIAYNLVVDNRRFIDEKEKLQIADYLSSTGPRALVPPTQVCKHF